MRIAAKPESATPVGLNLMLFEALPFSSELPKPGAGADGASSSSGGAAANGSTAAQGKIAV